MSLQLTFGLQYINSSTAYTQYGRTHTHTTWMMNDTHPELFPNWRDLAQRRWLIKIRLANSNPNERLQSIWNYKNQEIETFDRWIYLIAVPIVRNKCNLLVYEKQKELASHDIIHWFSIKWKKRSNRSSSSSSKRKRQKNTLLKVYSVSQSVDNQKFNDFFPLNSNGGWRKRKINAEMEICRVKWAVTILSYVDRR